MAEFINEYIKRELKSWTKKIGRTTEELLTELVEETVPMVKQQHPDITLVDLRKRSVKVLKNKYRRLYGVIKRSRAELFRGFIEGSTLQDRVQTLTNIANAAKRDEEKKILAIETGSLSEDGVPLDNRTTVGNRPNPNYQKPLANAQPQFIRNIFGFCLVGEEWKEFRITAWEKIAETLVCPAGQPVEFRATIKQDKPLLMLGATQLTKFKPIEADWDMEAVIRENGKFKELKDLDGIVAIKKSDKIHRFEVTILNMTLDPERTPTAYVTDDSIDFEDRITVFLPPELTVNFGDDTDAYLLGRVGKSSRGGDPIINAVGICPLEGQTTFKGTTRMASSDLIEELM